MLSPRCCIVFAELSTGQIQSSRVTEPEQHSHCVIHATMPISNLDAPRSAQFSQPASESVSQAAKQPNGDLLFPSEYILRSLIHFLSITVMQRRFVIKNFTHIHIKIRGMCKSRADVYTRMHTCTHARTHTVIWRCVSVCLFHVEHSLGCSNLMSPLTQTDSLAEEPHPSVLTQKCTNHI